MGPLPHGRGSVFKLSESNSGTGSGAKIPIAGGKRRAEQATFAITNVSIRLRYRRAPSIGPGIPPGKPPGMPPPGWVDGFLTRSMSSSSLTST